MKRLTSIFLTLALFAFVTGCDDGDKKKNNNNASCGNDVIEGAEVCDGTALGTATCDSEGFVSGTLGCLQDCSGFDTSGCSNVTNNTTPGHVGDPCTETAQCVATGATCFAEVGYGMPSGYCVSPCDEENPCTEEGTMCVYTSTSSFCAKTCTLGGTDCRVGYECVDTGEGAGACWANCTTADHCPTTGICDTEEGFCVTPPEVCDNSEDDDFDELVDCDDDDCAALPECGCEEDAFENHDGGTAHTMDLGTLPSELDGHICGPANEDWFAITPSISFAGIITLTFVNATGDLDLFLTDSAFTELDSSQGMDDVEVIEYDFVAGTTYYINVVGYAGSVGAYTLNVDYSPADLEAVIVATPANGAPGGSVALEVTLTNVGGLDAASVTATLTGPADVTIDDGTAAFGTITVDGTAVNTADALTFTIGMQHNNNQPVNLTLAVADTAGNAWSFPVSVPVPFASLEVEGLTIDDNAGNNDGYADPAENVHIAFDVANNGAYVATGPISVAVTIDASSTVTDATLTAPGNLVCSATDLAAGATAACAPWALAIPAGAANEQTIVLNFAFTDAAAANTWNVQQTIIVGPPAFASVLAALDPSGDNGTYACDLRDLQAFVDGSGVLNVKMIFHTACSVTGIHDIYLTDGLTDGATALTLTLEDNAKSVWSTISGGWDVTTNPSTFTVAPLSGSTTEVLYTIPVADIPDLAITGNTLHMAAAVRPDWTDAEYSDYAPDTTGDIVYVTFTW